jgi:bifunctional non-homologous end joining protein LigD
MPTNKEKFSFSNTEKVFWPREHYTKGDMLDYYEAVASTILPHLRDRPMVLNRYPGGITGESFFQKQVDLSQLPPWVKTAKVHHSNRVIDYVLVQDLETLLYVVNLGSIELNPFLSKVPSILAPDYMVIDLDPEDVPFKGVVEVALTIHEILNSIGAENYCKTSGGRGLHIYVPLGAKYDFSQSQNFAHVLGLVAQTKHPRLVSLVRNPRERQKRVYVDFLRNSQHQTVAVAYCLRPKPHAPVSAPLRWDEVNDELDPLAFNIETMPQRIVDEGDLFAAVLGKGVDLAAAFSSSSCLTRGRRGSGAFSQKRPT